MAVSKEITPQEHSSVKLTVKVDRDDVRAQYDDLLKEYTKSIQIPGFRRGKVPREVLIRKFGDSLKGEALNHVIEKSLGEVFEDGSMTREQKPLPYSTPRVEDEPKLDPDTDLTFSVIYDVLPAVNIGQWKGLEVEVPDAEVTDDDLNRELETIRDRNAFVLDREDGAAAEKDNVVTVNYCELGEDGEALPGTERQDFVFTLGSVYNIYQFDDEVTGMKKGETKDFEKTFPDDFVNSDLAGKTKKIRVSLSALKEKKLPDLDDDLAQDVDEKFTTLEDLKNSIRERLNKNLERRLREIRISRILEKIVENTPVDIPESMIRIEIESRWRNLARRFNTTPENIVKMMGASGKNPEEIQEEWRPDAVKALHSRLIVETLIEQEKFEASGEEMDRELERQAGDMEASLEEVKKYYENEAMKEYLTEDVKERKLFDVLLAENTIKRGKRENYLDIMENNG
ncbi:MAG: trigger factor [Treponema sp.]|nr:trigger factor [Treponema sp.]